MEKSGPARLVPPAGPAPTTAARRDPPPIPVDPALPGMGALLDPDLAAEILQRSLGGGATLLSARLRYLRYKPNTNLVVHYEAALDTGAHDAVLSTVADGALARRARKEKYLRLARSARPRSPAFPLVYDGPAAALVEWFPFDLRLPALAEPREALEARLRGAGVILPPAEAEEGFVRLAYKPRRRAVLRCGRHVLKFYASAPDYASAAAGLRASASLLPTRTAAPEAAFPDRLLTVQVLLSGSPVDPAAAASEAGELLSELHRATTPPEVVLAPLPPVAQLRAAAASAALASHLLPGLRGTLEALLARLESEMPRNFPLVPSHGDFHAGQLLAGDGGLRVLDFDEMRLAPAALDAASYAAHLVDGEPGSLDAAASVLDALRAGYGRSPDGLAWYVSTSVLRRATFPFRRMEARWPRRVEGMVRAAEAWSAQHGKVRGWIGRSVRS